MTQISGVYMLSNMFKNYYELNINTFKEIGVNSIP